MSNAVSKRFMSELAALQRFPMIAGNDLFSWKLIVVGASPYDFPLRLELVYPPRA